MNTLENNQPVSWTNDRLPEYLWIGLILMNYPRTKGIEKAGKILKEISTINKSLVKPKFSEILALSDDEQEKIYEIIKLNVDKKFLAPLTVIFRSFKYPLFNEHFNLSSIRISERIEILTNAVKLYYDQQSYEATDLRFVVMSMMIFQDKLKVFEGSSLPEAFKNYPYTSHDDEKMKMYRPSIRVAEMMDIGNSPNKEFIDFFWKEIGLKTNCKLLVIGPKEKGKNVNYKEYISESQEKINHLINDKKELSLMGDKFDVLVGTLTYVLKIFNDVIEKDLDDSILGRHAYRTVLESYINMKYLSKIESEHENIWQDYKIYGIGKYKFPLLKDRDSSDNEEDSHFEEPIIEMIINEIVWEEFVDIDLRYFDNKKVKEKFEEVGEKYLYDVLYEYDNNFIHGFWGAVRESSMLHCDNPTHRYHSIPDIYFQQKMSSISYDIYKIVEKFLKLVDESF